jgi:tetratricopeptide (TPR) repeat protein
MTAETSAAADASRVAPAAWFVAALLLTALAYGPSLANGLTNWDDLQYVTGNPFLREISWSNTGEIFRSYYKGNYHPLTMLSLSLDFSFSSAPSPALSAAMLGLLGESNAPHVRVHHVVNLLLHLANTGLVYLCLAALLKRRDLALLATLLFGVHPMHVESVAWVSARKDVLSAFFYLAALRLYIGFVRARVDRGDSAWRLLLGCLSLFVLALLSKGTAVALAPTLLVVDLAAGRRLGAWRVWAEKLPFFALGLLFGWLALLAQSSAGQLQGESHWTTFQRVLIAGSGYVEYLRMLVAPTGLSAFYPYPDHSGAGLPGGYWLRTLLALGLAAVLVASATRHRLLAFALGFYTLNIALVLQLIPVGGAVMADRYSYLPSIGLFVVLAAAVLWLRERWPAARHAIAIGVVVYVGWLAVATHARCQVWHDSLSLWNDTLARYPSIPTARMNRALALHGIGDLAGAQQDLDEAIRLQPSMARAWSNRGAIRLQRGDLAGARADLDRAIILAPTADAYTNRGAVRLTAGDYMGAIRDLDVALGADPRNPTTWRNRGIARAALGRYGAAIEDFAVALALDPASAEAHYQAGEARRQLGSLAAALTDLENALRLQPEHPRAHAARGRVLLALGRTSEACNAFVAAVALGQEDAVSERGAACGQPRP